MQRVLRCHAEGRDGDWEAFCLDLDITVQGGSFEDVFHALTESISIYMQSVADLPLAEQRDLLDRPAPLSVRLRFLWYALRSLITRDSGGQLHHHFTVPCAA